MGYFDGEIGTVIRLLAQRPRTLDELNVPPIIKELAGATKGLLLLIFPTVAKPSPPLVVKVSTLLAVVSDRMTSAN